MVDGFYPCATFDGNRTMFKAGVRVQLLIVLGAKRFPQASQPPPAAHQCISVISLSPYLQAL